MPTSIRNGLRSGTVFSVTIIFLALIGFTVTASNLIAGLFGQASTFGLPPVAFLVVFLGLLGLWNGANAAQKDVSFSETVSSGLAAGALTGLLLAVYTLIFGTLRDRGIDPRAYLSEVSPESIQFFLLGQGTAVAALLHLILQVIFALLGSLLAFEVRRSNWRHAISKGTEAVRARVQKPYLQFRRLPYAALIIYAVAAIILFLIPQLWGSYWNYIMGTVAIYVIMGLGLNIIVGLAGQLVLGYVAFFAMGAYSMALLTAPQPLHLMWGFWPALIVGVIVAAITGLLLGLPILRLRGDYLAIVTLGFGEIIRNMLRSDLLTSFTGGPRGVPDISLPSLFSLSLASDTSFLYLIVLAMLLVIFITNRLQNSRTGRAWVAVREDEVAARATGINTFQSKLLALCIGAAFAGLGGALFASRNQFTGPEDHALMVSINVLALVIVGGMGSIPGIILGAFALKGLPEILRDLANYRLLVFGGLLVVMMIWRPEGLWPSSRPRLEKSGQTEQLTPEPEAPAEIEGVKNASKP